MELAQLGATDVLLRLLVEEPSDDVRWALVATLNDKEAGMAEMSKKFLDMGANVYVDAEAVKASNKAL